MRVLDLFAGIGGFSLAAHWMGWETAAFVEWDKFCKKVLAKNFPNVPIYGDIKDFHYEQEREKIGPIDLICGGFPCQPFSHAGKRNGTSDDRYLWPEMLRVIREVKPVWVVGENVAGLLSMDGGAVFEEICASLEAKGYAVEAFVLPAISRGAPHRRDRIWIVAHAEGANDRGNARKFPVENELKREEGQEGWISQSCGADQVHGFTADAGQSRPQGYVCGQLTRVPSEARTPPRGKLGRAASKNEQWREHWYEAATRLCSVDDGVPGGLVQPIKNRTKILKAAGNAIVPQVVYEIFRAIEAHELSINP